MLRVMPKVSMFDSDLSIRAEGLKSGEKITLHCLVEHVKGTFESSAQYVADTCGNVDTATITSIGGSYQGET